MPPRPLPVPSLRRQSPESVVGSGALSVSGLAHEQGGVGQVLLDGRPEGIWAVITGQPNPDSNAYAFVLIDDGIPGTPTPVTGDAAIFGDGLTVAAFERGGNTAVPTDGSAIVRLEPLASSVGYGFTYTAGSSPPPVPLIAYCATTGPLPPCTYANNGPDTSGVGATLTANSPGALTTIDGPVVPAPGGNVLVWQQTDPSQNGLYTLVSRGDAATPWQLVRTPGADTNPGICGLLVFVTAGTQIFQRLFVQQQPVNTADGSPQIRFGFDAITFGVAGPPLTAAQSPNLLISTAAPTGTYPTFVLPGASNNNFSTYKVTLEWTVIFPNIWSAPDTSQSSGWGLLAQISGNGLSSSGNFPVGAWVFPPDTFPSNLIDTRSFSFVASSASQLVVQLQLTGLFNSTFVNLNVYCSMSAVGIS